MRFLSFFLLSLYVLPVHAQTADALMERFAEAWSQNDLDAVRQMLADDVVVVSNDTLHDGPDAVLARWEVLMAGTGEMTVTPIRSGETDGAVYQIGRWQLEQNDTAFGGTHHATFRAMPDGAYRLITAHISTDPGPLPVRAAQDEPVVAMINHVAPDKRADFEEFIASFWQDLDTHLASDKVRPGDQEAFEQTRVLFPARANEDSTYTYVFLADPYAEEADYSIINLLQLHYDEEEAQRRYALFTESLAVPQEFFVLEQSAR